MSEWRKEAYERLLKEKLAGCYLTTKGLPLSPAEKLEKFRDCLKKERETILKGEIQPSLAPISDECVEESLRAPRSLRQDFLDYCYADTNLGKGTKRSGNPTAEIETRSSIAPIDVRYDLAFREERPYITIGWLRLPSTLLPQMRTCIEGMAYKHYLAVKRSAPDVANSLTASSFLPAKEKAELVLPIEQGFLLLLNSDNNLYISELIKGEATFLDTYETVQKIKRTGQQILGVFHTHPHPTHSLIPGAGDYFATRDFDSVVGYTVPLLAVGGFYGADPVVHFFLKKSEFNWDNFLASPVLLIHDALFPPPMEVYSLQITPTETDSLRIYESESRIPIDLAKKIILSRYFDIVTINLNTFRVIDSDYADPEVLKKVLQVMQLYLDRFPQDLRRKMEAAIHELYPDHPESFIIFYRNTFLHFLEKSYRLRYKESLLGHLRRSLRFRYLRVKDFLEELEGLNQPSPLFAAPRPSLKQDQPRKIVRQKVVADTSFLAFFSKKYMAWLCEIFEEVIITPTVKSEFAIRPILFKKVKCLKLIELDKEEENLAEKLLKMYNLFKASRRSQRDRGEIESLVIAGTRNYEEIVIYDLPFERFIYGLRYFLDNIRYKLQRLDYDSSIDRWTRLSNLTQFELEKFEKIKIVRNYEIIFNAMVLCDSLMQIKNREKIKTVLEIIHYLRGKIEHTDLDWVVNEIDLWLMNLPKID